MKDVIFYSIKVATVDLGFFSFKRGGQKCKFMYLFFLKALSASVHLLVKSTGVWVSFVA